MHNKTVLLSGATSGIGKAAAIELAKKGYELIIPVRNSKKAQKLIQEIMNSQHFGNVKTYKCDFNDFDSVKAFVREIKKDYQKIDILINNAGVWNSKRQESKQGIEQTWAINVLMPYYLTMQLLPLIEKGDEKRIIFTASELHSGKINFEDIEYSKSYIGFLVYQQSKLADILITKYLAKELKNKNITVNCLHPGIISSNLVEKNGILAKLFFHLIGKAPEKGAETIVYLATNDEVKQITGEYFVNKKVKKSMKNGNNMEMAAQLIAFLDKQWQEL